MTDKRRTENVINMTGTLWELNKYKLLNQIEERSGAPVPEECYKLIEHSFRVGAAVMERAIGGAAR